MSREPASSQVDDGWDPRGHAPLLHLPGTIVLGLSALVVLFTLAH